MEKSNEAIIIKTHLKIYEKILFTLFKKTFLKVYNIGRILGINEILK